MRSRHWLLAVRRGRAAIRAFRTVIVLSDATWVFTRRGVRSNRAGLQRSVKRPKLTAADRFLWAWLLLGLERLGIPRFHHQGGHGDWLAA